MATVLVVDDEPDVLEILSIALEGAGHRVLTAENGAQALDVVSVERPDAMLLDVGMPEIDGWGVLERIKSSEPALAQVPVVMLTAWTSEEDRLRGGIEGALHYLAKPFDPADVVAVVEALLGDATPEPVLRRQVQQASLERLARMERGGPDTDNGDARVRLTRLDRPRAPEPEPRQLDAGTLPAFLATLPPKQRSVVERVAAGETVGGIAEELGVSRSNIYAILRRAARKTGTADGRAFIRRLRRIAADARRP